MVATLVGFASPVAASATAGRSPTPTAVIRADDPLHDPAPTDDCHADIVDYAGSYIDKTVGLSVQTLCGSNPFTDPHWVGGATSAAWSLATVGSSVEDYLVSLNNDPVNGLQAIVYRTSDFQPMCAATPYWDGNSIFGATFDESCIGTPGDFGFAALMNWTLPGGADLTVDRAPDSDFNEAVVESDSDPYRISCGNANALPGAFPDAGLAANCLKLYGIALGKLDGTFGEDDLLSRSQVSSLLLRTLELSGIEPDISRQFPDVNPDTVPNAQVRQEIELLAGSGIIAGFPDGTFGPGATLTVAQAGTLVLRTLQLIDNVHGVVGLPGGVGAIAVDQGSTLANYDYMLANGLLNPFAKDVQGQQYSSWATDDTARGLLADMLAVILNIMVANGEAQSRV